MDPDQDLRDFNNICRLFPLPNVVLFPHAILPLHIFEPRYRQMTEDALAGDRYVTMVQVRQDADWKTLAEPRIEEVACLGRILDCERLPDGRFNFLLVGCKRVRILRELPKDKLYRRAEVEVLEDIYGEEPVAPLREELVRLFRAVAESEGAMDPDMAKILSSDLSLGGLTDILGHALGLPPRVKQSFLVETHVQRRARSLITILRQVTDRAGPGQERPFPPPFSPN